MLLSCDVLWLLLRLYFLSEEVDEYQYPCRIILTINFLQYIVHVHNVCWQSEYLTPVSRLDYVEAQQQQWEILVFCYF